MTTQPPSLADKLKKAMSQSTSPTGRPWNASSLEKATSLSRAYLRNLISGKQDNPSVDALAEIATALDIPASYFLPGTPDEIEHSVWRETPEMEYLERLTRGLSTQRRELIIQLAEQSRELEQLPSVPYPTREDRDEKPPPTSHRRRFPLMGRGGTLPPDEIAERITRSLTGQSGPEAP